MKALVFRQVHIKDMSRDVVGKVFGKKFIEFDILPMPGMQIMGLPNKVKGAMIVPRGAKKKFGAAYLIFMEDETRFTCDGHFEKEVNATHEKDVKKNLTANGWTIVSEKNVPFC